MSISSMSWKIFLALNLLLAETVSPVLAHGHDHMGFEASDEALQSNASANAEPAGSYFNFPAHRAVILAHVVFMVIAWVFVLPIGVMLSIVRSRLTLIVQLSFLALNSLGIVLSVIYNGQTPDLYKNNSHHKLGWISTWIVSTQVLLGFVHLYTGRTKPAGARYEHTAFLAVSGQAMTNEHPQMDVLQEYRWSGDSGQGTEPNTASLRSNSPSPTSPGFTRPYEEIEYEDEKDALIGSSYFPGTKFGKFLSKHVPGVLSNRALRVSEILYDTVDRTILLLGFVTLTTGIAIYGGFFRGREIFNGLAHWIKGGIFFWYGLLTFARWMGCFAEFGWAWNNKPHKTKVPSAEFIESFVIFLYGASNVFLEHLTAWGQAWSAMDLEHVSIAILFFGGGLCGMFVESQKVRDFLNTNILFASNARGTPRPASIAKDEFELPLTYRYSMNPFPALVIMLLGSMMGHHSQDSMLSSMVHKQWGSLLMYFGFARCVTYVLIYLSPPKSVLPSRPPSEIIASFCLMAGGLTFMVSSRNTIQGFARIGVDAMFVSAVTLGSTAFLMAWTTTVMAIKGWAAREGKTKRHGLFSA